MFNQYGLTLLSLVEGVLQAQGIMPAPSTSRKRLRSTSPEAGSSTQRQRRADRNSPSSDDEVIEIKDEGELNRMMVSQTCCILFLTF